MSLVPLLGIPADIASGLLAVVRGDVVGVSLSVFAIFSEAGGAVKAGRRVAKVLDALNGLTEASRKLIRRLCAATDPQEISRLMDQAAHNIDSAIKGGILAKKRLSRSCLPRMLVKILPNLKG